METVQNRIAEIKQNGYDIDFSTIFNNSFENYKKIALISGISIILFSAIIVLIFMGIVGAFLGFSSFTEIMANFNPENFSAITVLVYVTVISLIGGLASPVNAGILKIAYLAANNKDFSLGTIFDYYNSSYFKQLFISTIIISICTLGLSTTLESMGIKFIGTIITYIVYFFTFLTIPLIIFGNLKAIDAIQGSFIIVSKQIFVLLGLLIVAIIIACLGLFGFCIGIFFTMPFIYSMYFCIYNTVIKMDEETELDSNLDNPSQIINT